MNKQELYTIGEMSRITSLTVKTLRFYDETGLLTPVLHDSQTGYRYYDSRNVEKAEIIVLLKNLGFQLEEIKPVLYESYNQEQMLRLLAEKKTEIDRSIMKQKELKQDLSRMEQILKEENSMKNVPKDQTIQIKQTEPLLVASLRYKGRYEDVGIYISRLYKHYARVSCGSVLCRYHDGEYKEEDADIEVCLPIKKKLNTPGFEEIILKKGQFVSLLHIGAYDKLGQTYQALTDYCKSHNLETITPSREIYLKGPGMFFRGNAEKYITEVQFLIK